MGVRNIKNNALMGCITAVPVHVRVYERVEKMAEINFLCVHKKLRFETVYLVYVLYVCMYVRMLVNQLSYILYMSTVCMNMSVWM